MNILRKALCLLSGRDGICVPHSHMSNGNCDTKQNIERRSSKLSFLSSVDVPLDFHEPGILTGYRCAEGSSWLCILSLFHLHNETLNIWTQIIPAAYFVLELYDCFTQSFNPFMLIYLSTIVLYLLTSACAHTFSCVSMRARHICFFFDYVGLTLYSCGCAIAYYAYALPVELVSHRGYLGFAFCDIFLFISVFLSAWSTHISCTTRFWKPSFYRKAIRFGAFLTIWTYLTAPVFWRVVNCSQLSHLEQQGECATKYFWSVHFLSAVAAGFLYVSHIPERIFPGKFDIFGHSHQIFHVFGASATLNQYMALKTDIQERQPYLKRMFHVPSVSLTIFCISVLLTLNVIIFVTFYRKLVNSHKPKHD